MSASMTRTRKRRGSTLLAALFLLTGQAAAGAQSAPAEKTYRWSVAGGPVWTGSYPIGDATADLRQNAPGTPPPSVPLFRATSTFDAAPGIEGRFGFALTPRVTVEAGGRYSSPALRVDISQDLEGDAVSFEGETIAQYVIDVSVLVELPVLGAHARLRPFAIGGAGYLRQLHEDRVLVETGQLYHAGGGARLFFRGHEGDRRPLGLRADVQAAFRRDGIEFEGKMRVMPTASVLLFFGF